MPVALLAPLGASDRGAAAFARDLVDAARMAVAEAGPGLVALDVRDTRGTPDGAAAAARAALESGAALILGPLFGAHTDDAAEPAAARGVNLLGFSNTPSVAGGNVWLLGRLASDESERILVHAVGQGISAVGVFHPLNAEGEVARSAAAAAARRLGVRLAPAVAYPRSFEGIQDAAPDYAEAHLAAGAQAVLLPDGGQGLQAAAAFLNQQGLTRRETLFLGLGRWDSPATPRENALRGGRFASLDPALAADFAARFEARHGRAPAPDAVIGYDAAAAALAMARRARAAGDPTPFDAAAITDPAGFQGAAGRVRLTAEGLNARELAVMAVRADGFEVLERAPSADALAAGPGA